MPAYTNLFSYVVPESILIVAAGVCCLMGVFRVASVRKLAPLVALGGVVLAGVALAFAWGVPSTAGAVDPYAAFALTPLGSYVKALTLIVASLLILLAWPSDEQGYGNASLDYGRDAGEFFGLMLLSFAGVLVVAGANDTAVLFMGIELASIPTYVLVALGRPLPAAQEAGVKYFFLGAMSAAIMLFGFSYLYGTTGTTDLRLIGDLVAAQNGLTSLQMLAVVMLLAGFAFKIAAVPLHFYAGDVYQGAATPVTTLLSFVPKTVGMVALIKVLYAIGGNGFAVPPTVVTLLWWVAALTMTVGNVLGLLQFNVKRVLAYSSIAHTGYMLVAVTAVLAAANAVGRDGFDAAAVQRAALGGVLFYLAAYGLMNVGAFGGLMLLPSRARLDPLADDHDPAAGPPPATTAETYEDLAGQGRRHPFVALAMAVCMFSLIGLPLTAGFFGKIYLIDPALAVGTNGMVWLVVILLINAAISAAYYLKIVATLFLRPHPDEEAAERAAAARALPTSVAIDVRPAHGPATGLGAPASTGDSHRPRDAFDAQYAARRRPDTGFTVPVRLAVALSVVAVLGLGVVLPATDWLTARAAASGSLRPTAVVTPAVATAR